MGTKAADVLQRLAPRFSVYLETCRVSSSWLCHADHGYSAPMTTEILGQLAEFEVDLHLYSKNAHKTQRSCDQDNVQRGSRSVFKLQLLLPRLLYLHLVW